MTNSADPDQLASSEANWSGSTLFIKTGHVVLSKRRIKLEITWHIHVPLQVTQRQTNQQKRRGLSVAGEDGDKMTDKITDIKTADNKMVDTTYTEWPR